MVSATVIHEFVAESLDHLNTTERDLLAMESGGGPDRETLNRVFRAVHSIKGSSGTFGFPSVMQLSHAMESLLLLFRNGKLAPDYEKINALLAGVDKLRAMISNLQACDEVACEAELKCLNAIMEDFSGDSPGEVLEESPDRSRSAAVPPETAATATTPSPCCMHDNGTVQLQLEMAPLGRIRFRADHAKLAEALVKRHYICVVLAHGDRDLENKGRSPEEFLRKLGSYGQCLDSDLELQRDRAQATESSGDGVYRALLATVLEPDLVGMALDLPTEQIQVVDPDLFSHTMILDDPPGAPRQAAPVAAGGASAIEEPAPTSAESPPSPIQPPPAAARPFPPSTGTARVSVEPGADPTAPTPARTEPAPLPAESAPAPAALETAPIADTIRVSVDILDTLMNLAGELVLGRNQLRRLLEGAAWESPKLGTLMQHVSLVTSEMQEHIMRMRMQPISNLENRLRRVVRELSHQLAKEIELVSEVGEVELDKSILEGLSDPLTHLIRNSVDHGIEPPAERLQAGKPAQGQIRLRAFHEGGQVHIRVIDDGRGIDPERVVRKALAGGLVSEDAISRMGRKERLDLVFQPGFSTAVEVTDISGRGVGMDVVKTNIQQLGGHIELESVVGVHTTVCIRLPLTLAIIPSLVVGVAGHRFAIPQVNVQELICIPVGDLARRVENVGEAPVLRLRERLLPLVRLTDVLDLPRVFRDAMTQELQPDRRDIVGDRRCRSAPPAQPRLEQGRGKERRYRRQGDMYVVVLRVGGNIFGLIVDELFDIEEIVVKPLSTHIKDTKCFAGATIMGDGRVAMILDASGIAEIGNLRFAEVDAENRRRRAQREAERDGQARVNRSIIVFNGAPDEYFALPLELVSRLEMIERRAIKHIGAHEYITYRGKGLPLVRLEQLLDLRPIPDQAGELFVIIPRMTGAAVGIVASRIVDIIETDAPVEPPTGHHRGFTGSMVLDGQLTLLVNVEQVLELFERQCLSTGHGGKGAAA